MVACVEIGAVLLLGPYLIKQYRMILNLVYLLRHPGRIAQFGLAARYIGSLCYWPAAMLLVVVMLTWVFGGVDSVDSPLEVMTLTEYGSAISLCSWIAMTIWFRSIIRRDLAIYREPAALVPAVVMALICLTYAAAIIWIVGMAAMEVDFLNPAQLPWIMIAALLALFLLAVPTAPLASFVLLIVHVARVRAARTWETYIPPQEDEIP